LPILGVHKIIGATKHVTNVFLKESSSLRLEKLEIMKRVMCQQFKLKDLLRSNCVKAFKV
jgi:hypothetical protein